jgi:hypothetical protein
MKSRLTFGFCILLLVAVCIVTPAFTQILSKEVGPSVGQQIPAFKAIDQFGRQQTLSSLVGSKGLVLLFVRSADW